MSAIELNWIRGDIIELISPIIQFDFRVLYSQQKRRFTVQEYSWLI